MIGEVRWRAVGWSHVRDGVCGIGYAGWEREKRRRGLTLYLLGLLAVLPTVNWLPLECLYHPALFAVELTVLLAVWARLHAVGEEGWGDLRLKYEESPDPAIHGLNLLR